MMVFVDGENLLWRYQSMLKAGKAPAPTVEHKLDAYAWTPHTVQNGLHVVLRSYYYTAIQGDEQKLQRLREDLKTQKIQHAGAQDMPTELSPRVFARHGGKSKGVDIQMTVDILTNVYQNNLDAVYLVAGDGDYRPVIEEAMRNGKQVWLAALSDGLSPLLKTLTDRFIDLDQYYFAEP